jgi:gamma-glutamyltranspeptidase/glutathione hydrolase
MEEVAVYRSILLLVIVLVFAVAPAAPAEDSPPLDAIKAAIAKSLPLLEAGARGSMEQRKQCFTCHNQGLPILALTTARARGLKVDSEHLQTQLQFIADFLGKNKQKYLEGKGTGGQADTAGYALWTLDSGGWKPDETTAAVAEYLLLYQRDADHWKSGARRPPTEQSSFTTSFVALRGLKAFGTTDQRERIEQRFQQVRQWLLQTTPEDTEDRVFRLRALQVAGAADEDLRRARDELLQLQRSDGGWSQLADMESDTYATGSALVALHQAGGLSIDDAAYRKGLDYLISCQQHDGSWHVVSRSKPFQAYFESGYPHGTDQFISIAAAGWATTALTLALPEPAAATDASAQTQPAQRARPSRPASVGEPRWEVSSTRGAVVAGGQEAVEAGLAVLKSGGNAADAAAATLLAQTVTDANQFCFGGEVPIMVYDARRGIVEVLAGQGAAPRLATPEEFRSRDDGILDRGEYPWHIDLARTIRRLIEAEKGSPDDRRRGLRLVADYFYRGPIAREIDAWSQSAGALLRYSDLATHVTRVEEPVTAGYRGYTVYKCGPWTQGPYLLQALQMLEGFNLKEMGHNQPDAIHLTVEAMKLALADRDVHFGDPLFEEIPLRALLSPHYADLRRPLIDLRQASLVLRPGDPRGGKALLEPVAVSHGPREPVNDTSTCLVADGQGNVIAATPSGWSGVLAGDTGIWLGSRLQSFNLIEESPNCLAPGKRPRITLTPTLVLKDGKPRIAVSVAGGDGQDQVTLQLLLNVVDFGLDPAAAVTAPRFETKHFIGSFRQPPPELGVMRVADEMDDHTVSDLKARGHEVKVVRSPIWVPTMLTIEPHSGLIRAAGDPKAGRHAAAD